jgi:hypothetical protein
MLEAVKTATLVDELVPVDVGGVLETKFLHLFTLHYAHKIIYTTTSSTQHCSRNTLQQY